LANATSETVVSSEAPQAAPGRTPFLRILLKWIILAAIFIWVFDLGVSLLINHSSLRRRFTAHLTASFGRPVEVGSYDFTMWTGPELEANSVVVADDPRFGYEYFLRAESLMLRFRLRSLLRGHVELQTLSLSHPSLNLVRNSDGDWNLYEWLPKPSSGQPGIPSAPTNPAAVRSNAIGPMRTNASVLRFRKIEIDGGRINFKEGDTKEPVAFIGVKGTVETVSPGRWRMDLDATPMRAAIAVQQPGMIHLTGHVGGTSSRLRPADLELSWRNASITDVLRLARSYDYGVHGTVALYLSARTDGDVWLLNDRTEFRQVHRWDLPLRADNPSLNFTAEGKLDPANSRLDISRAAIETLNSRVQAAGRLDWSGAKGTSHAETPGSRLEVTSAGVDLNETLAWLRAFHTGVAEDLALAGWARLGATLRGWPPHIEDGALSIGHTDLTGKELRAPLHFGPATIRYDAKGLRLQLAEISVSDSQSALRVESSETFGAVPISMLHVSGSVDEARDIFRIAKAFGWDISGGWDFGGPLHGDLRWQGGRFPWRSDPLGSVTWGSETTDGTIRAAFLNQPIERIRARADFKEGERRVALAGAEALGARWSGTLNRTRAATEWQFSLVADHLSASELDLWLNPRWRESFLDRMLPFLNPRAPAGATPDNLRASGRLAIGEFSLGPLNASKLQGELSIEGRRLEFANFTGQFAGGAIRGSLDAGFVSPPAYHVGLQFTNAELGGLTAASPGLANIFSGAASGEISFHARGANRADLAASLECQGAARASNAEIRGLNLAESVREGERRAGNSSFREASGTFSCVDRAIRFRPLRLIDEKGEIDAVGAVNFGGGLNLHLQLLPAAPAGLHGGKAAAELPNAAQLSGTLADPHFTRIPAAKP
jgi:hypothetical protein